MKINWFKISLKTLAEGLFYDCLLGKRVVFDDLTTYLIQGYICKDCKNTYNLCRCIDILDFSHNEISEFTTNWIIYNISRKKLKLLVKSLKNTFKFSAELEPRKKLFLKAIEKLELYEN